MHRVKILDYSINADRLEEDVEEAFHYLESGVKSCFMACANPHSLVVASKDSVFRDSLQDAELLVPDGTGVVLAARTFNTPVVEKVAGYDFFIRMTEKAARRGGVKYFFLGSSENVLSLIRSRMNRDYPSVDICGTYSPPFKDEFSADEEAAMIDAVNQANPDVLWVGMTAPKQEKWIYHNRSKLHVHFIGAIGAVFDFYAGTRTRPSRFWQKLGLEWLPRFLREPRRLWERNLKSTPIFMWWVLKEKLRLLSAKGDKR